MAVKQYAYYIKGNQIGIVEKDTQFDNDTSSRDFGPGSERAQWKSPKSTVSQGLELEYAYAPDYFLHGEGQSSNLTHWGAASGFLVLYDYAASYTNYVSDLGLAAGDYLVITNADQWNGLHKISGFNSASGTNNGIRTETLCSETDDLTQFSCNAADNTVSPTWWNNKYAEGYSGLSVLSDEDADISMPSYLNKALVYYVKAKIAEDMMNIEAKEYFMVEFRKLLEKYNNTRVSGLRIQAAGPHSIR